MGAEDEAPVWGLEGANMEGANMRIPADLSQGTAARVDREIRLPRGRATAVQTKR